MLDQIKKIQKLLSRQQIAKELGIEFDRVKNFRLPDEIICNKKKIPLSLPSSESGMLSEFIEIILDDCYNLRQWRQQLKPNIKILDIGANVGLFSLIARQYFPEATIHSYEPNLALEIYLKEQARMGNFNYYMQGVGSKDGRIKLKLSNQEASTNTVSIIDENGDIEMLSLSKAIERLDNDQIDLLKMDCEGAEWDILQASDAWEKVQNLEMEYHLFQKGQTLEAIQNLIKDVGFTIIKCQPIDSYYGNITAIRS